MSRLRCLCVCVFAMKMTEVKETQKKCKYAQQFITAVASANNNNDFYVHEFYTHMHILRTIKHIYTPAYIFT